LLYSKEGVVGLFVYRAKKEGYGVNAHTREIVHIPLKERDTVKLTAAAYKLDVVFA
jgi:hypothetical protein